jgi:5-methylcytosine-specific restriction endonuclease McrA
MSSRKPKKRLKYATLAGFKCEYCGAPAPLQPDEQGNLGTIEHFWPKWLGGTSSRDNAVWACLKCNATKAGNIWPIDKAPPRVQQVGWIKRKLNERGL